MAPGTYIDIRGKAGEIQSQGFSAGSDSKESAYSAGDPDAIPELERSPGGGQGNPLQYSGLENPMDTGAWRAAAHGVAESQTCLEQMNTTGPSLL